jgi:hypothetical protein
MKTLRLLALLVGALALTGCFGYIRGKALESLRQQAAFDFSCAPESLELVEAGSAVGVRGCAKKASYVQNENYAWVMSTPLGPDDTAAPTPAAPPQP